MESSFPLPVDRHDVWGLSSSATVKKKKKSSEVIWSQSSDPVLRFQ